MKSPHKYINKRTTIQTKFINEKFNPKFLLPSVMYFKWHDVSIDVEGCSFVIAFWSFIFQIKLNRVALAQEKVLNRDDFSAIAKSISKRHGYSITEERVGTILADKKFLCDIYIINGRNNHYLHKMIIEFADVYSTNLNPKDLELSSLNF